MRYGAPPNISVANDTMVIAWPAGHFDDYAPRTPETVRLTLPGSAVASGAPLSLGSFVVTVDAGSATLSGSLAATPTEAALRSAEPQTLRLTLEGDTWAPTVGLEGDVTNALLSSLSSAQSEAAAWLEVVKPGLSSTDLERLDAHTLVLTVPQRAAYDIAAPETISWSVPAEATFGLHRYEPEAIELLPTAGSAKMLGSMMVRNTDAQLQNDEEISLVVRLTGDSWVAAVDQGGEVTRELLAGLASAQSEAYGWNAVVRPFLGQRAGSLNITLQSTTELTIGLPSISLYDISVTESISLTIPPSALVSQVRANPNPNPNPNPNLNRNAVLQTALEAPLEHSNAALLGALDEPIAMLSGSAPLSPGTRPMRLVPRSPRELDRRRAAGHAPGTGGTFGTPVLDGMLKASIEKRVRSVASTL